MIGSAFGYTGVQAKTWVFDVFQVWDPNNGESGAWRGYHPQGLYMAGAYPYWHFDGTYQADFTEVGWVKDPGNPAIFGDFNPHIYSAVTWNNRQSGFVYRSIVYGRVDLNREITLKIQKEWDGGGWSWHGYYAREVSPTISWTQILWASNAAATGAAVASSERRIQAYESPNDGFQWHDGDIRLSNTPDFWSMIRRDRNADDSPRWWGSFGRIEEIPYGSYGFVGWQNDNSGQVWYNDWWGGTT